MLLMRPDAQGRGLDVVAAADHRREDLRLHPGVSQPNTQRPRGEKAHNHPAVQEPTLPIAGARRARGHELLRTTPAKLRSQTLQDARVDAATWVAHTSARAPRRRLRRRFASAKVTTWSASGAMGLH